MAEALIYDHLRTPRGKGKADGSLHEITAIDLASQILKGIRDRNGLDTSLLDDVALGCAQPVGEQGGNIGRGAVVNAGYAESVAGQQVQRFCGSGLEAVNNIAAQIMSGQSDAGIAGGVESMSRTFLGADSGGWAADPAVVYRNYYAPQGIGADIIATVGGFTRTDVDAYAVESQRRAAAAWEAGYFRNSIMPVRDVLGEIILDRDEFIRPNTTLETLSALKPSFEGMGVKGGWDMVGLERYPELESINHVHHAGNSSGIVDGSAAVLLGNKAFGVASGLKPRARIKGFAITGTEPTIMLTGPAPAAEKVLKRLGMSKNDIDLFELNEAFASVVLRFIRALDIDPAIINVNGGAIAMGHPLGATGAMILGTALDELERRGLATALITLCIGNGMGIATVIERI